MNKARKIKFKQILLTMCLIGVMMLFQSLPVMAASAVTVEVSTLSGLQAAIDAAQDGDVIGFKGQIELYADAVIGDPGKHITLKRTADNSYLSLSYSEAPFLVQNITFDGAELSSNFSFISIGSDVTFQDVTIKNVVSPMPGGAVSIGDGEVYFKNCTFDSNSSMDGSHIRINSGKPTHIENCTFTNGHVTGKGGAILIASPSSTCNITSSTITGNSSDNLGGGIYNSGVLTITDSKIFKNIATNGGADIANDEFGTLTHEQNLEVLQALYADENIIVKGWVSDFTDAAGGSFLKLDFELPAPTPTAVILDSASLGTAGDGKITGLTSSKKYKVSVDGTTSYVKADGTLTALESESGTLTGTEIVGLTNGKTYKVEEYTPVPTPVDPTPTPTPDPTPVTPPSSNNNSSGGSSHSHYTPTVTTVTQPETKKAVVLSYGKAVMDTTKTEYLIGYTDGMLGGKDTLTKAQFVQIVYRLLTPESRTAVYSDKSSFKDVASNSWYYEAVNSMANAGLISVGADGKFNPDKNVTWGEMVNILAKFAKPNSEWKIITKHWAKDAINTAISYRWFEYNDQFNPDGEVTRLEMLNFINTMFKWSKQ